MWYRATHCQATLANDTHLKLLPLSYEALTRSVSPDFPPGQCPQGHPLERMRFVVPTRYAERSVAHMSMTTTVTTEGGTLVFMPGQSLYDSN